MVKSRKGRIKFFVWLCITVVICTVIFRFSSQNGGSSGELSEGVTRKLFPFILSDEFIYVIEKVVRKIAHYSIYFLLGISAYSTVECFNDGFYSKSMKRTIPVVLSAAFCFLYSLTDEFHQTFVSGRNGAFTDCLLDTFGSLSGIIVIVFF